MGDVKLSAQGRSQWLLSGSLDLASIQLLSEQLANLISVAGPLTISLKAVEQSSSAGLAALLQALQVARQNDCNLSFEDIPDDLAALARMSNVLPLLGSK